MTANSEKIAITIPSLLKELKHVEKLSVQVAKKVNLDPDQRDNLSIAVTEAVGNAIVHGNKKDPNKNVDIVFTVTDKRITVRVTDQGKGFDPKTLANPLDPENLLKESGRGIFILKSLMDDVAFEFSPKGTTITFFLKIREQT